MTEKQFSEADALVEKEVREGGAPGAVLCFLENGEMTHSFCTGLARKGAPVRMNSIFRLYSMSKPVTAAAAWMLHERGMLDFERPVSDYFPAFAHMKVMAGGKTVDAEQQITLWDLLNMTSGIVYPDPDEAGLCMAEVFDALQKGIRTGSEVPTCEVAERIAAAPLAMQPQSGWRYGLGADVMGAVIEKVSGMRFYAFLKENLFDPLEMKDTGFYVPEDKQDRFTELYKKETDGRFVPDPSRHLALTMMKKAPAFESGGAGLVSTPEDYLHFLSMLLTKGAYHGKRILSEETVTGFTQNRLSPEVLKTVDLPQMKGYGYGSFMRTGLCDRDVYPETVQGEFGWDGWSGPYFSADIRNKRAILFMTQVSAYQHWDFLFRLRSIWLSR